MTQTEDVKTRPCLKCKRELPLYEFQHTPAKYFPGHRSLICTDCLEKMHDLTNLDDISRLMQYLDLPFDINMWTQIYQNNPEHPLYAYFNMLADDHYSNLSWAEESERWRKAREEETLANEVKIIKDAELTRLRRIWSASYKPEQLIWLNNFYEQIEATQNVSTPILQEKARDFCELQLHIKEGLRAGVDVSKMMKQADDIVKTYHFEASNAKSTTNFESIGELMVYYGKKGWHPKWHVEPQDSIDFMMENIQNFLKRLVINEGNFAEQVEDKRNQYNLAERLETIENEKLDDLEAHDIEYEGEDRGTESINLNT